MMRRTQVFLTLNGTCPTSRPAIQVGCAAAVSIAIYAPEFAVPTISTAPGFSCASDLYSHE